MGVSIISVQVWAKVSQSVQHKSDQLGNRFQLPSLRMPEYDIEGKVGNYYVFQIVTKWVTRICDPL